MLLDPIISLFFLNLLLPLALPQDVEFIYNDFRFDNKDYSNLRLDGAAGIGDSGLLVLTNHGQSHVMGHAFYSSPVRFKDSAGSAFSFSTVFAFYIVPSETNIGGDHGLAFVIAPTKDLKGALPAQYLGIFNDTNTGDVSNHIFAVEFDTSQSMEFSDINDNHVGIDINSLVSHKAVPAVHYGFGSEPNRTELKLASASVIQVWIDYNGTGKTVEVTLSPFATKPNFPTLRIPLDLSSILLDQMFVGFSAATGMITSSHNIVGWSLKINGEAQAHKLPDSILPSLPDITNKKKKTKRFSTNVIVAISVVFFFILVIGVAFVAVYRFKKASEGIEPWEKECGPRRFSYEQLKHATNGFKDERILGAGGFGKVYKGVLPGSNVAVAVKRVVRGSRQGLREFVAEIESIGRLSHRNLVPLLGWCRTKADLLLVYDYMPNGSLDKYLFSSKAGTPRSLLSWAQRIRILRGVASALLFLHEEWEHVVIHRDVKAGNVLLDADMNGRLGDFGLAKLYEHGANPSTTRLVGTLGYLAPELARTGQPTTRSDVFAFGVLVLEVGCGRRPIDSITTPDKRHLIEWVADQWACGRWEDVVDARLGGEYDRTEAEMAVKVGTMCTHPSAEVRPTMREVVSYLNGGGQVPDVPSPRADYECRPSHSVESYSCAITLSTSNVTART